MATLYLVSTPIGNLGDLSPRAAETLRSVATILAEDTRRTRVLARHAGSEARLVSLHAHNEAERCDRIVAWLDDGLDLALVSDAGTPLVSDPGARVVRAVTDAGHAVVPIPGPSAVIAALVASGISAERFTFLGFPERKGPERRELLERVGRATEPTVLFESPNRLVVLLEALEEACGSARRVAVARELTKIHEEIVRGTLSEVAAYYRERPPKGEVTLVVGPAERDAAQADREGDARDLVRRLIEGGMKPSAAARVVAERLGLARNEAYRIVHELAEDAPDE